MSGIALEAETLAGYFPRLTPLQCPGSTKRIRRSRGVSWVGQRPGSPCLELVASAKVLLLTVMPHKAGRMPRSRTGSSRVMPRRTGPKTRSSLRTILPHLNHREAYTEAGITLWRKVWGRSGAPQSAHTHRWRRHVPASCVPGRVRAVGEVSGSPASRSRGRPVSSMAATARSASNSLGSFGWRFLIAISVCPFLGYATALLPASATAAPSRPVA
jgi:hypothetical protein